MSGGCQARQRAAAAWRIATCQTLLICLRSEIRSLISARHRLDREVRRARLWVARLPPARPQNSCMTIRPIYCRALGQARADPLRARSIVLLADPSRLTV